MDTQPRPGRGRELSGARIAVVGATGALSAVVVERPMPRIVAALAAGEQDLGADAFGATRR
ncbi:hypothetical protein [Nocardioides sp.]|uniref:hypothetical protein n=1 Tax=Nocardioides sp. TaxID=35761 RepID=UPI00263929F2|nr:hypothetical protein [Nocardioides sp.]MCW2738743.1 hypothetical protein [Nocardioides sp.]